MHRLAAVVPCDGGGAAGAASPWEITVSSRQSGSARRAHHLVWWGLMTGALLSACGGGGGGSSPAPTPNQAPVAVAKLSGEAVLQAATVFDTTGTADPDGSIASRSWAYGDGQTGSADSHIYTAPGTYTATLTVTDNAGATASTAVKVSVAKCSAAGLQAAALSPFTTVCVQTTRGEMVFDLFTTNAPLSTANFLAYVDRGFYNGLLFHRVLHEGSAALPGGVVQGGGYLPGLVAKAATDPPIKLESNNGLKNSQYTVAMARTSVADSATTQFFINPLDNPGLNYNAALGTPNGYAVFGLVISGTAVVDAIGSVATTTVGGLSDVPVQDVVIRSIVRLP